MRRLCQAEVARPKAPHQHHSISLRHSFMDRYLSAFPPLAETSGEILDSFAAPIGLNR